MVDSASNMPLIINGKATSKALQDAVQLTATEGLAMNGPISPEAAMDP